jgi:hypothetical protein
VVRVVSRIHSGVIRCDVVVKFEAQYLISFNVGMPPDALKDCCGRVMFSTGSHRSFGVSLEQFIDVRIGFVEFNKLLFVLTHNLLPLVIDNCRNAAGGTDWPTCGFGFIAGGLTD